MNALKKRIAIFLAIFSFLTLFQPSAQAKQTFYLDMKKGCYAGNSPVTNFLEWSLPGYKKVFRTSCYKKYHYQVYLVTRLSTNLSDNEASQSQAGDKCSVGANRALGNRTVSEYLSIGWFYPDAGAEERKYGKKLICFFRTEDIDDPYFTVAQTRPMA